MSEIKTSQLEIVGRGGDYHIFKEGTLCGCNFSYLSKRKLDWLSFGLVNCEECLMIYKFINKL